MLVPGSARMSRLSEMLLAGMGWTNSHLHQFRVGDHLYGMHVEDWPEDEIDEKGVTILQALHEHQQSRYEYDFGDGWEHTVLIEELTWPHLGLRFAVVLDGDNACPPEDVGGPFGYVEFLEALADPDHEEHNSYLDWAGGPFDPAAFDVAEANARCQKVR